MSVWGIVCFIAAYLLLAVMAFNVVMRSDWGLPLRLVAVLLVGALYWATMKSIPPLLGWPTTAMIAPRFNLIGVHIREPDKAGTDKGNIYLWVTDMEAGMGQYTPRAHVLPFTPELQTRVAEAGVKLRKNLPQMGEASEVEDDRGLGHRTGRTSVHLDFYDMPDPLFPEK